MKSPSLEQRLNAFVRLGERLVFFAARFHESSSEDTGLIDFQNTIHHASVQNAWFTPENTLLSLHALSENLKIENLQKWIAPYKIPNVPDTPQKIAVIMAGNIPLVGFHDFLCVLISGNVFIGKLSSNDLLLLPALAKELCLIEPQFEPLIRFSDSNLADFDAVIATGSNNTARYFEYYFGKYPGIIRQNRNSVAVLSGNETKKELEDLSNDVFVYFGLGCRSVSKLFVPDNYDWEPLMNAFDRWKSPMGNHTKYQNNYTYNKTILLLNRHLFLDNGFLLLKSETLFSSPISILNYEIYKNIHDVNQLLQQNRDVLQCVVSELGSIHNAVKFGESQAPQLWDYADNVDTLNFLLALNVPK